MATWDANDLIARMQRVAKRPTADADLTSARALGFLNDALHELTAELAAHVPDVLFTGPVEMTTADNKRFTLPSNAEWRGRLEVYERENGDLLIPGAFFDIDADYTIEGHAIRITGNRTRAAAPWARYVPAPTDLVITPDPTTPAIPTEAMMALVYLAVAKWAAAGGDQDPTPYLAEYRAILWGRDGYAGAVGYIPSVKQQAVAAGGSSYWWRGMA